MKAQLAVQSCSGKKNVIIDSRPPGTAQSEDQDLEDSFVLFHSYNKYRGFSLGYNFFFDASDFLGVRVFWTKALCLYLLHVLFPEFLIFYVDSDAVMFDQVLVDLPRVA